MVQSVLLSIRVVLVSQVIEGKSLKSAYLKLNLINISGSRKIIVKVVVFIILFIVIVIFIPTVVDLFAADFAAEINSLIVLKAFIAWLKHVLLEVLFHVLLVPLQLIVTHFVEIGIFVVELLKIIKVIFSPTVIPVIAEFPSFVGRCIYSNFSLRGRNRFSNWLRCFCGKLLSFVFVVLQVKELIRVEI